MEEFDLGPPPFGTAAVGTFDQAALQPGLLDEPRPDPFVFVGESDPAEGERLPVERIQRLAETLP